MSLNRKAILGLILALIVGGLGNGVWEYVLEPAFAWSVSGILNIATLGIQSFKDDLYREVAKGFHEESSLALASSIYYWVGYGVAASLFLLTRRTKELVSKSESLTKSIDELEAVADGRSTPSESESDIRERISGLRRENLEWKPKAKLMHKAAYALFVVGVFLFAWMAIGTVKDRYINSAIVHYEQSIAVVAPMATDKELAQFKSRFARIASRSDYELLVADLARVGERGGLKIPELKVW